ncbi:hypothetical protein FE257_009063 [Aspergillus nanangensis]|uniref:RNA 3'-terminal phosphate cyclase domain-containing protein n=1 Tax=Aspergillus nanangensis TaxID=2582783 RepID=A0AAD4CWN5_ASPNN|nr:hypothetical protein FE257_009063 [Aspergillus nanangensis]
MPQDSSTSLPEARTIHLDGRTLEGGGQLVRIAVALSALTRQPVTIDHIRGNRQGKKGLKGSHLAAIKFLADVSGSSVSGAGLGSSTLGFRPSSRTAAIIVQSNIKIQLPTAGSVFLVFQALYPYLLHASSQGSLDTGGSPITLAITGGTNVSFSPSFDYVSQVVVPNFSRIGLPHLSVHLNRRGWATGPFNLGTVTIILDPLHPGRGSRSHFPSIDLNQYQRGKVTHIDITVLAPDDPLTEGEKGSKDKGYGKLDSATRRQQPRGQEGDGDGSLYPTSTIRQYVEQETFRKLRKGLQKLPSWIFDAPEPVSDPQVEIRGGEDDDSDRIVPIRTHTSEATHHPSHLYVLIVAHTSSGFNIGHDTLNGARQDGASSSRQPGIDRHRLRGTVVAASNVVEQCVAGFLQELYDAKLQGCNIDSGLTSRPCVDEHMRDQVVIFEALGAQLRGDPCPQVEDERYWSLHTKTAQWVCEKMMR